MNIIESEDVLLRISDIDKLAGGGRRNIEIHLNSIESNPNVDVAGKPVIVIADVTTSGNSMLACEQILYESGAASVVMIAVITFFYRPVDRGVISFRASLTANYHRDWLGHISVGTLNKLQANEKRFEPNDPSYKMANYNVS